MNGTNPSNKRWDSYWLNKSIQKPYKLVPIMGTIMKSKEGMVLELFFDCPTKEWHFEEILSEAKIARSKADGWLKKLIKEGLIRRVKNKGRMPYYISNYSLPKYKNRKKVFALNKLCNSGLLDHLGSLQNAESVIIFGSFSRSDWHKGSDIDIFIYGSTEGLDMASYEMKLNREIQLFACKNKKELGKLGNGLLRNIVSGNIVKGNLDFIEVGISA